MVLSPRLTFQMVVNIDFAQSTRLIVIYLPSLKVRNHVRRQSQIGTQEASCVAIRGPFGETIKTGEWDTRILEFQTAHGPLSLASGSTHGWYFPNHWLGLAWLRIIYVASKIRKIALQ